MSPVELVGLVVNSDCGIWGVAEYARGQWVGVRGPGGRLDEIQASRVWVDAT